MPVLVPLLAAGMLVSACGTKSERTPEPSDTQRTADLIDRLGTDRSYNSRTLLWNPEPDGRILSAWSTRRAATLNGRLNWDQLPASTNPGSVGATLAWERQTEKTENALNAGYDEYSADLFITGAHCPDLEGRERLWLDHIRRTGLAATTCWPLIGKHDKLRSLAAVMLKSRRVPRNLKAKKLLNKLSAINGNAPGGRVRRSGLKPVTSTIRT
jgi:hypothetical protein